MSSVTSVTIVLTVVVGSTSVPGSLKNVNNAFETCRLGHNAEQKNFCCFVHFSSVKESWAAVSCS